MIPEDHDLIHRQDAISAIRAEKKHAYTAAQKYGFAKAESAVKRIPGAKVCLSPTARWFAASGWWLCDCCGGRCTGGKQTPYCPWCGARMGEADAEIE